MAGENISCNQRQEAMPSFPIINLNKVKYQLKHCERKDLYIRPLFCQISFTYKGQKKTVKATQHLRKLSIYSKCLEKIYWKIFGSLNKIWIKIKNPDLENFKAVIFGKSKTDYSWVLNKIKYKIKSNNCCKCAFAVKYNN